MKHPRVGLSRFCFIVDLQRTATAREWSTIKGHHQGTQKSGSGKLHSQLAISRKLPANPLNDTPIKGHSRAAVFTSSWDFLFRRSSASGLDIGRSIRGRSPNKGIDWPVMSAYRTSGDSRLQANPDDLSCLTFGPYILSVFRLTKREQ